MFMKILQVVCLICWVGLLIGSICDIVKPNKSLMIMAYSVLVLHATMVLIDG